ncbi:uncharacterized protein LOC110811957 [Carica papaya]|uniref:uncharacterized protein LOC110811957 n=1 Tax=Carica papaya TaxID=3649 RepID=UPI000B8CEEF2|nr:uncharacterized protein LOC110811957 [Carica papaya]
MGDRMEASPSSEPLDLDTIRSRLRELEAIQRSCKDDVNEVSMSDSESLLKDCTLHIENKVKQIVAEYSNVDFLGIEDLDSYLEYLKKELQTVQAETAKISYEIELLSRTNAEDSNKLESDLEGLLCSLDFVESKGMEEAKEDPLNCYTGGEDQSNLTNAHRDEKFEILELESQIEKNQIILKSFQGLDSMFKRLNVVEQIEDSLTGLKDMEFDGNYIRLSLQTYIPQLEVLKCQRKNEDIADPSELNHELLIEILDGSLEPKNIEMFPNDVYIGDIVDAAKSFRQISSKLALLDGRSSLEWVVGKVQERIILTTLRRLMVKSANKSRHSFEYLDRDETVVAHLVGGVDAFLKISQDWPLSDSPLKLISLKSSDHHSKGISLSLLCKVEEVANSLGIHMRQNLSSFGDAIEKLLIDQMRLELHSNDMIEK